MVNSAVSTTFKAEAAAPTKPLKEPTGKALIVGGDFQTFLKMLTAQIKNQDPLNPMEGSDFAVQLATFSGVEQQVHTNNLLKNLTESGGANALAAYSDWIGKQVRTTQPVYVGADPLMMDIPHSTNADQVFLVALNAEGDRVRSERVEDQQGLVYWQALDAKGAALPVGIYSFMIERFRHGEMISSEKVPTYTDVVEVARQDGEVHLTLSGGAKAKPDDVEALAIRGM
ncbi:flagellar basal body rod modification protein [Paracoccus albus]|nr:flagellar hook capping FlgD N-terminal domain-containing protein [Paracoccus albus]WBU60434.1 flagellar basal body rod modification protein [Paracoccus albus]